MLLTYRIYRRICAILGLKKEDQVLFTGRLENQERKMLIKYKDGKMYNVRIIPIPMAGKTSVSFIDNAKGSTPAEEPVPKDRTAQIAGQNTVRVLWKPPADTSQCGNKYLVIVKNETFQDKATVTDTKYVLSNMNPASVYIFNIHATDKQGKPFNASASIKVRLSKTQYTTVKNLSVSKVNGSAIKVSWSKPVPADKFKDEYHVTVYGQDLKKTYTTKETSIVAGGLDFTKLDKVTVQNVWKNGTMFPAVATVSVKRGKC
ncbi:unnamed protein product [Dibothriocephalus latus]|uniref:Fibronectin type-III domain-containing protein n=1 Tax=Dibothriocephalus latus TaxID=60516 RepID=A0A3P7NYB9_DIBLA|nr:unnamed protein product [Dibothriocephalus latus]